MKNQETNQQALNGRSISMAGCLLVSAALLFTGGCHKSKQAEPTAQATQLNDQERSLSGQWTFKKCDTYEVSGVDSVGSCSCTLIGTTTQPANCHINFKSQRSDVASGQYKGEGAMAGCDSLATFVWDAKQTGKLEIGSGLFYNIEYLTQDSAAFSFMMDSGVLKLKKVLQYKR